MKFIISNTTTITNIESVTASVIADRLTLKNPEFIEALKHGRWAGNIAEHLRFYRADSDSITFPRGFTREAWDFCRAQGHDPELVDNRRLLPDINLRFQGDLRDYQEDAARDILDRPHGVLEAATGSGKTVIALYVISQRHQPTLIIVHTKELLNQWVDRIRSFLGVKAGMIGNGKFDLQPITVGTVQTVRKHLESLPEHFGQLVVDECHRTPSSIFSEIVRGFDCKFILGLSATPFRRDGMGKTIFWYLGDLIHKVDPGRLRESGSVLTPEIIPRRTDFSYPYCDDYCRMISALIEDDDRNQTIIKDLQNNLNGGCSLVASDRVNHLERLASMTSIKDIAVLTGKTPAKDRERIVDDLAAGKVKVLFSTIQLLGEGFDCPGLSDLYLASPVKFRGRLIQIIGRILRPKEGKQPRIFDYVDTEQPVLMAQWKRRQHVYRSMA